MNPDGDAPEPLFIQSRRAMLDVLELLDAHRASIIVVGAHAIYLQTANASLQVAPFTRDSDFALDPKSLKVEPLIDKLLLENGYRLIDDHLPGSWTREGDEVDFMVPSSVSGGGRRAARIPPHGKIVARKTVGLEGALVDFDWLQITSLEAHDSRGFMVRVAGPAALITAKLFKIRDRVEDGREERIHNKDAHDIFRLLADVQLDVLRHRFRKLQQASISTVIYEEGLSLLDHYFAHSVDAIGVKMVGAAEEEIGKPSVAQQQVFGLARELLDSLSSEA